MKTTMRIISIMLIAFCAVNSYAQKLEYRKGEVIVKLKTSSTARFVSKKGATTSGVSSLDKVLSTLGVADAEELMAMTGSKNAGKKFKTYAGNVMETPNTSKLYLVKIDEKKAGSVEQAIAKLKVMDEVEYAEPNYIAYACTEEEPLYNDPVYPEQYNIPAINLPGLWAKEKVETKRPIIAILDTGCEIDHPDLADNIWTNTLENGGEIRFDDDNNGFLDDIHGWNFVNSNNDLTDQNGHGTHCAGVAAAVGNNNIGIVGANPDAYIMPLKVLDAKGQGDQATIIKAIDYAIANGANVISMSFGWNFANTQSAALEQAMSKIYSNHIIAVAAAGNKGNGTRGCRWNDKNSLNQPICRFYPAGYSTVVGVVASDEHGNRAEYSNYGRDAQDEIGYDVMAPGTHIWSTFINKGYRQVSGTSMATPMIAGALSRILQIRGFEYAMDLGLRQDLRYASNTGTNNVDMVRIAEYTDDTRELQFSISGTYSNEQNSAYIYPVLSSKRGHVLPSQVIHISPIEPKAAPTGDDEENLFIEPDMTMPSEYYDIVVGDVEFGKSINTGATLEGTAPFEISIHPDAPTGKYPRLLLSADNAISGTVQLPSYEKGQFLVRDTISGMIQEDITLPDGKFYANNYVICPGVTVTLSSGTILETGPKYQNDGTIVMSAGAVYNGTYSPGDLIIQGNTITNKVQPGSVLCGRFAFTEDLIGTAENPIICKSTNSYMAGISGSIIVKNIVGTDNLNISANKIENVFATGGLSIDCSSYISATPAKYSWTGDEVPYDIYKRENPTLLVQNISGENVTIFGLCDTIVNVKAQYGISLDSYFDYSEHYGKDSLCHVFYANNISCGGDMTIGEQIYELENLVVGGNLSIGGYVHNLRHAEVQNFKCEKFYEDYDYNHEYLPIRGGVVKSIENLSVRENFETVDSIEMINGLKVGGNTTLAIYPVHKRDSFIIMNNCYFEGRFDLKPSVTLDRIAHDEQYKFVNFKEYYYNWLPVEGGSADFGSNINRLCLVKINDFTRWTERDEVLYLPLVHLKKSYWDLDASREENKGTLTIEGWPMLNEVTLNYIETEHDYYLDGNQTVDVPYESYNVTKEYEHTYEAKNTSDFIFYEKCNIPYLYSYDHNENEKYFYGIAPIMNCNFHIYDNFSYYYNYYTCFILHNYNYERDNNSLRDATYSHSYGPYDTPQALDLSPRWYGWNSVEAFKKKGLGDLGWRTPDELDYSNVLFKPSDECPGMLWKVVIGGYDAHDDYLCGTMPSIGIGKHKFELYFNKQMDKNYIPRVVLGYRQYSYLDFTERTFVNEEGSWNEAGDIFTVYKTISSMSSIDGENHIKVSDAYDLDGIKILTDDVRNKVMIQVAGAMSTGLMAEAGIGKVDLTWETDEADFPDLMGYNVYRCIEGQTNETMVNTTLISPEETHFTDFDVIPGVTYLYSVKEMGTDFKEFDVSNQVAATPLSTIKGDANGSCAVDVADIVTEVQYIVGQNPQPFIFESADVDENTVVDVLDVVGTVNIITGSPISSSVNENEAVFYIENGVLYLETPVVLAGVQVTLNGNAQRSVITPADALKGFEQTGLWQTADKYLFLAYSMNGSKVLSPGKHAILNISDVENIETMTLSDAFGKNVKATLKDAATGMQQLRSDEEDVRIYDLSGKESNANTKGLILIQQKGQTNKVLRK